MHSPPAVLAQKDIIRAKTFKHDITAAEQRFPPSTADVVVLSTLDKHTCIMWCVDGTEHYRADVGLCTTLHSFCWPVDKSFLLQWSLNRKSPIWTLRDYFQPFNDIQYMNVDRPRCRTCMFKKRAFFFFSLTISVGSGLR